MICLNIITNLLYKNKIKNFFLGDVSEIKILEINDLYKLAKRRVPKMFFEYADTGSWTSSTYKQKYENDFTKV